VVFANAVRLKLNFRPIARGALSLVFDCREKWIVFLKSEETTEKTMNEEYVKYLEAIIYRLCHSKEVHPHKVSDVLFGALTPNDYQEWRRIILLDFEAHKEGG
jgi:hypothetical protein